MRGRDKELLEACKKGTMYDYISNNAYQFSKDELVEILKQTYYSIYQRLQDQNKEVEQLIPWNLYEYGFFEDLTADEIAYIEYIYGARSYKDYLTTCEFEEVEPEPAK